MAQRLLYGGTMYTNALPLKLNEVFVVCKTIFADAQVVKRASVTTTAHGIPIYGFRVTKLK